MTEHAATDCVFCQIARGEIGTEFVAETANAVAFRDLSPHAPTHVLIIPRRHIPSLRDLQPEDAELAGDLLLLAADVAKAKGLEAGGYRVLTNDGADAGQTVAHLHFHLLGGKPLHVPLG